MKNSSIIVLMTLMQTLSAQVIDTKLNIPDELKMEIGEVVISPNEEYLLINSNYLVNLISLETTQLNHGIYIFSDTRSFFLNDSIIVTIGGPDNAPWHSHNAYSGESFIYSEELFSSGSPLVEIINIQDSKALLVVNGALYSFNLLANDSIETKLILDDVGGLNLGSSRMMRYQLIGNRFDNDDFFFLCEYDKINVMNRYTKEVTGSIPLTYENDYAVDFINERVMSLDRISMKATFNSFYGEYLFEIQLPKTYVPYAFWMNPVGDQIYFVKGIENINTDKNKLLVYSLEENSAKLSHSIDLPCADVSLGLTVFKNKDEFIVSLSQSDVKLLILDSNMNYVTCPKFINPFEAYSPYNEVFDWRNM